MPLRKDIHKASLHSFTHCAKVSIMNWVISWKLRGREIPRHSACPRSGTWLVRKPDVSESALFLIRPLPRDAKIHGLGTSHAAYQGKSGLWYLTQRGFSLIRTLSKIFCFSKMAISVKMRSFFLTCTQNSAKNGLLMLYTGNKQRYSIF